MNEAHRPQAAGHKKYGLTVCVGALPPMLRGGGHEGVEGFFKAVRKVPFTL